MAPPPGAGSRALAAPAPRRYTSSVSMPLHVVTNSVERPEDADWTAAWSAEL
jgi:hypothetical protein